MFRLNSSGKSFPGYIRGRGKKRRIVLQVIDTRGRLRQRVVHPREVVDISV